MTKPLPLAGLRVVEFVHMVMGPACGLILADLGAEVIKVEGVEGDSTRHLTGSGAGYWPTYNRNKQSLAIDLKSGEGIEAVRALLATADIVTENFRPGAMEKLGLGYDAVRVLRADIIYCSMKGFLPGPYEQRPALDEVVQMMGGLAYMTGPEGRPLRAGASVNDVMGGMFAAIGILAAVVERQRSGQGQLVQSGLFENNVFLVAQHMMQHAVTGKPASPMPNRLSAWAVYDVFGCAGGEQVFVGAVSDAQWRKFVDAFELHDLAADALLATNNQRVAARERFMPRIRECMARLGKAEVMRRCEAAGLPFAPITRPQDLFDDPHLLASEGFTDITLEGHHTTPVPRLPLVMDGTRFGTRRDLPAVGQHSRAILRELGYADSRIDELADAGKLAGP
ncbi:CaiB/BaiF CoA transferase family protein [Uliginosibacterium sp. H1]|uniref:CaiB/BaiF CoA transferase family protein n=1 Tax=Uliginosibacterium sp. H1 TaxID=3114757 RepID=UPI002E18D2CD|nr:CaiB/BaiF CoA-transferase family protein [Uliginosibacterium sp. H1]